MISANPRLPTVTGGEQDPIRVGWMHRFYEHFYAIWRDLAEYIIRRGEFSGTVVYTPTWTATSGTAPAIGDGSITGRYILRDNICRVWIELMGGAATTWGDAGYWRFSLPFTASRDCIGSAHILDASGGPFAGFVATAFTTSAAGSTVLALTTTPVTYNSPMTWAASDVLILEMEYFI